MAEPKRVLMCGSRGWTNRAIIQDEIRSLPKGSQIVVGYDPKKRYPPGADRIIWEEAWKAGIKPECHPADWLGLGRRAGFMRNMEMFEYPVPHEVIAFWDGNSPGTASTLKIARLRGVPSRVRKEDEDE